MNLRLEKLLDLDIEVYKEADLKYGKKVWEIYIVEHSGLLEIEHQFQYKTEAERDAEYNDILEYLKESRCQH